MPNLRKKYEEDANLRIDHVGELNLNFHLHEFLDTRCLDKFSNCAHSFARELRQKGNSKSIIIGTKVLSSS